MWVIKKKIRVKRSRLGRQIARTFPTQLETKENAFLRSCFLKLFQRLWGESSWISFPAMMEDSWKTRPARRAAMKKHMFFMLFIQDMALLFGFFFFSAIIPLSGSVHTKSNARFPIDFQWARMHFATDDTCCCCTCSPSDFLCYRYFIC